MNPVLRLFLAPDRRLRPSWRFWISIVVFGFSIGFAGSLAMVVRKVGHGVGSEFVFRTAWLVFMLLGFALLLYALDRVRGHVLRAMGLALDRAAVRDSLVGTALGAGMVAASVAGIAVVGRLEFHWSGAWPQVGAAFLAVTYIIAVAAMAEEVAFRGYPFQRLVEGIGAAGGIILLSVLFGAVHLGNPHATIWGFLNTILIGAFLAIAYLRTRSLWLPWGVHFGWNFTLGVVFGLPVSGLTDFAIAVQGTATGPGWLTGGSYGIEASLTATVVIVASFFVLLPLTRAHAGPAAPVPELAKAPE
jgi:membrane protease YdiL (CAAX protease family)